MSEWESDFDAVWQRVLARDEEAARQFVLHFEPEIRRVVRVRLTDPRLRQMVDSMDVCQSVFGKFFSYLHDRDLAKESPENLLALLVTMVQNKIRDLARRQKAQRRDVRRKVSWDDSLVQMWLVDDQPTPDSVVSRQELLRLIESHLSVDEREIAEMRASGWSWLSIGEKMNQSSENLRKKLERALARIRAELHEED
jgi:RNA polymerase sigma factor (sigma-70 family)